MIFLVTTVAGAVGALCRWGFSGIVQQRTRSDFPVGTLVVNLAGAFLLGVIAGRTHLDSTVSVAAAGFLGGFTTFSTWMIETIRLGVPTLRSRAFANLIVPLLVGIVLAGAGYSLAGGA